MLCILDFALDTGTQTKSTANIQCETGERLRLLGACMLYIWKL